jgi:DNA-binding LacI/PurR family transcriptional regulator
MARKPSSPSITIRDVARQAGVSVATVSRYINDTAPVSEPVAERIQEVLTRLKYVPHAAARQLATQKMMAIGLLLNNVYNDYFGILLYGIESVVQQNGYNLLVATSRPDRRKGSYLALGAHNVDGLLVFADSLADDDLKSLSSQDLPIVLIHRSSPKGLNLPSVTVENKAATFQIVDHLITKHGRRKILFFQGPVGQEDSYWREQGYKEALAKHGIKFDSAFVLAGDFQREVAYASMQAFINANPKGKFDAVFAGDDSAAIGVMDALEQAGYHVPKDVSVAGFNDSHHAAFLNPPLTTIKAPTHEVGRIAVKNLFNLINHQTVESITLLPTEIIVRQSCGCTG